VKLGDDDPGHRVGFLRCVEDEVSALDVAGKHQKLGEQHSLGEISRAVAHRGIGCLDGRRELAGAKQLAGGSPRIGHQPLLLMLARRVTSRKLADTLYRLTR